MNDFLSELRDLELASIRPADFARAMGVSLSTYHRMRRAGELPPPDLRIRRIVRWKPSTIQEFLTRGAKRAR